VIRSVRGVFSANVGVEIAPRDFGCAAGARMLPFFLPKKIAVDRIEFVMPGPDGGWSMVVRRLPVWTRQSQKPEAYLIPDIIVGQHTW